METSTLPPLRQFSVRLDDDLIARATAIATRKRMRVGTYIRDVLIDALEAAEAVDQHGT